jgi:formate dehydrogenase major subunit/NADH-quinone oxidoreductase subunit G
MNATQILEGCANGAIRTLVVAGENPLVSYPNQTLTKAAIDKVDFLVVTELFLSETAKEADVVLPVCSYAEKTGTFAATDHRVQKITAAIPAVGSAKPELEIYGALISRLGGQVSTAAELFSSIPAYAGISYDAIPVEGQFVESKLATKLIVPTYSAPVAEAGKYALLVGSALYHCGTMSQHGEGPLAVCPEGYVELSRTDAAGLKVEDGDLLTLTSAAGSIKLKAKVGMRMSAGVLFTPSHFGPNPVGQVWTGGQITYVTVSK